MSPMRTHFLRLIKGVSWKKLLLTGLGVACAAAITGLVNHLVDASQSSLAAKVTTVADQLYDDCRAIPVYARGDAEAIPLGGGVGTPARILIQRVGSGTIIVARMEVVVISRSKEKVGGFGVPVVCQGDLIPRNLRVNLDESKPRLVPMDRKKSLPVTVSEEDPEQFVVLPNTQEDVQWKIAVHLIVDGEEQVKAVPEEGSFRTIGRNLFAVK